MSNSSRRAAWRRVTALAAVALAVGVGASDAMAQGKPGGSGSNKKNQQVELTPPTPARGNTSTPWFPLIAGSLVMLMITAVNFIPSKRGHQD